MTPVAPTHDVIVDVRTDRILGEVGVATVDGFWREIGRPVFRRWQGRGPIAKTVWKPIGRPTVQPDWES